MPGARVWALARPPRTPAPRSRAPARAWTHCSRTPAWSVSRRCASCSTPPRSRRRSRCRAAPGSAVVTNAGGPAILCADACEAAGLEVPELSKKLRRKLARALPPHAATSNPVDMLAAAGPAEFEKSVTALASSGEVDAVIAIFVPALAAIVDEVDDAVANAAQCGRPAGPAGHLRPSGRRATGSRGRRGSRIRRTRPARWLGSCATSSGAMSRAGSFRR